MTVVHDPYKLPEGNVQIAFSGGRTSAYMLHQVLQANGGIPEDRCEVTFQNTGREREATLDFVQEVGRRWCVPITWLEYTYEKPLYRVVGHQGASRNGEPFDAIIAKKQALPNQAQKWCSAELKSLTAKRYLVRERGWKSWTSAVGFRADETHRAPHKDNRATVWLPLRVAGVSKHTVAGFWKAQQFDLRLPIVNGKTVDGNCDGCFLKSEAVIAGFGRDEPKPAMWWETHEVTSGYQFSKRYSRRQLREYVERQHHLNLSDEGQLCQRSGGECY